MSHLLPTQRTKFVPNEKIENKWILIDAEGQTLGRLASRIAFRIRGKHRPDFSGHQNTGDFVVVINADKLSVTGKKLDQKQYHRHSGYPGGLRSISLRDYLQKDPARVLELAVRRMLPKGRLGRKLLNNLKVYAGSEHPHASQKPEKITITK